MGSGLCVLEPSATSCTTGVTTCSGMSGVTSTPDQCDGIGGCTLNPVIGACPGNASCANGSTCNGPACGTSDGKCATGYYCDGMSGGACQAQQAMGAPCTRDAQCTNGCNTGMMMCK